jgi:hypothetical protein
MFIYPPTFTLSGEQERSSPLAPYTILNLQSTESSAKVTELDRYPPPHPPPRFHLLIHTEPDILGLLYTRFCPFLFLMKEGYPFWILALNRYFFCLSQKRKVYLVDDVEYI